MEQFVSQNWPQVMGAIALIVWLIRNEASLKEAKADLAKLEEENREIRHKLQSQDVTLARIDETLKGLKLSFDRFIEDARQARKGQ